jgi:hypothetical protein
MNSLTSAQRERDSLRSSFSHHHGGPASGHGEKGEVGEEEDSDHTFNPHFHPGDLDTPLQVEYNSSKGISSLLPFSFFTSTSKSASASDAPTESIGDKVGQVGQSIKNAFYRLPSRNAEEPEDHYTLRTAGSGRRSSLARACSYTSAKASDLKQMTGLTVKMQHKKLPTVSYQPPLGRRESERIFVAHEEFEGLPDAPGDGRPMSVLGGGLKTPSLGDIEEGGSDGNRTPRYFTPPRIASPAFGHGGEWTETVASGSGTGSRAVDFGRSPESNYEPQVGMA